MLRVFIDTNILFEHALKRYGYREVLEIFKLAEDGTLACFCSASCFYTLSYVIKKQLNDKETRLILNEYLTFISILPTTTKQLSSGLLSSFKDIEDAFQYYTALNYTDHFITLNKRDFLSHSSLQLPVYTPGGFLKSFA